MNKFFIFLLLFFIGINSYAQQNQIQIIPVENGRVKGFSIISDTDTVKIDTMFYNIDKQYYNIDVMVKIIDGFEWSIKNVDAKVADKENELNKLMKKYYRMGYESGWMRDISHGIVVHYYTEWQG